MKKGKKDRKSGQERSVRSDGSREKERIFVCANGHRIRESEMVTIHCPECGETLWEEEEQKKSVLVVAHGDLDGIVSAVLIVKDWGLQMETTEIKFTQPFLVDKVEVAETVEQVFVVDIAVNNRDLEMTKKFIERIGDKLVVWHDHHKGWGDNDNNDSRFFIDEEARSCAEQIRDPLVIAMMDAGEVNQWVTDANAADTRQGKLSPRGRFIEEAMKANMSDDSVREAAVRWIVNGCAVDRKTAEGIKEDEDYEKLRKAQGKYQKVQEITEKLAERYKVCDNGVAVVDVSAVEEDYDRTQLLLKGEQMSPTKTAVLLGKNPEGEEVITVATMDKSKNLVNLFGLPSGAPFRVSLPVASGWTVKKVLNRLERAGAMNSEKGEKI
jgi:hypothetical protein